MILDGGACLVGVESTVLDVTGERPVLLRPGGLARDDIEAVLGAPLAAAGAASAKTGGLRSPGQLASHYAPTLPLRLNAGDVAPDEALLAFGPTPLEGAAITVNLSETGDLTEAAANLFSLLHHLDRQDVIAIAVMPIPATGLRRSDLRSPETGGGAMNARGSTFRSRVICSGRVVPCREAPSVPRRVA